MAGLGKGLSALIANKDIINNNKSGDISKIAVDKIQQGKYQPRNDFNDEELKNLAESIKNNGIIQPILLRPIENNRYEIIAGERRYRAAMIAGMKEVPTIIKKIGDREVLQISIIENIQRENLNAIEECQAYHRLVEEFQYTTQQIAEAMGKSRSHIANIMRLTKLPQQVQDYLIEGKLQWGHARAIINADNPILIAKKIIDNQLTVRESEELVRNEQNIETNKIKSPPKVKVLKSLSDEISKETGLKIAIKQKTNKNNNGNITINYQSLEEFNLILSKLR